MSLRCALISLVTMGLAACGDGAGEPTDPATGGGGEEPNGGGAGQAGRDGVAGAEDAGVVMLPECVTACDRVIDCAAAACDGISWSTAGAAQRRCSEECSPALAREVTSAAECGAVLELMRSMQLQLAALCETSPCESACQHAAGCIQAECDGFAQFPTEAIVAGCMDDCDEQDVGGILGSSCGDLVNLLTADPSFAAACHGQSQCAPPEQCIAYADKLGDCAVDNCGAHAAPYRDAMVAVLYAYCARAEDCPAEESVAYVLSPEVACDDEPLSSVGPAAPFTAICEGNLDVTMEQLHTACERLVECGAEFESTVECAGLLAIDGDADAKVGCVLDASAECAEVFSCL